MSYDEPAYTSLVRVPVGVEEYVLIERARGPARSDVFLETSPADLATDWFFAAQPARLRPRRLQRSFLDDEAGILLGVSLGLGRSVKARHTIPAGAPLNKRLACPPAEGASAQLTAPSWSPRIAPRAMLTPIES